MINKCTTNYYFDDPLCKLKQKFTETEDTVLNKLKEFFGDAAELGGILGALGIAIIAFIGIKNM